MPGRLTPREYSREAIALAEARQLAAFQALRLEGEELDATIRRFTPQTDMDDLENARTWDVARLIAPVRFSKYEDQERFPLYQLLFQICIAQILAREAEPEAWPMLVTLPSGSLDAYTERDPIEGCELVFLERGMLDFVVNASRVVNWLLPEGPVTVVKGKHTTSMGATAALHSLLVTYGVEGTPGTDADLLPIQDIGSIPLRKLQAPRALSFLLMHELAHIRNGHTRSPAMNRTDSLSREFQCDTEALLGTVSASQQNEREWGMPFFVADTFLCALNALVLTLSRLWRGDWTRVWQSTTHPPPWERRWRLKEEALLRLSGDEAQRSTDVYAMNTAVWGNAMRSVQWTIELTLQRQPQALHPLWHSYAQESFGEGKE